MPTDDHGREHASFRVDDRLYLDYQQVAPDELANTWRHDTSHFCDELIHLREISLQSSHILANIRKHQPDIGTYLSLLDKKIELLTRLVGAVAMGGEVRPTQRVNLGTDGMRFMAQEALPVGGPLRLKLVLFPSRLCLHLQSTITTCQKVEKGHLVEVAFKQVGEAEHEVLIRHLLEKQSAARRRERGN